MTQDNGNMSTRFLITVDTETYAVNGCPPTFDSNIYASAPRGALGVPKIIEICDRYGIKGTFFVDVYMHHYYGKRRVRDLCRFIAERGHDVQLHAHPSWLPDGPSESLTAFDLQRQTEIIAEGRDLLSEWVGRPPVAFRAGSYAANLDTIRAIERNGFRIDSSYFAFHQNCSLSQQLGNRYGNTVFRLGQVLEIPVTTYWLSLPTWRKISKVDINSSSLAELCDVIPKLVGAKTRYIVLFLHSFSFIRWRRDYSGFEPNTRALQRFEAILSRIASWGYQDSFCTMEQVARELEGGSIEEDFDFIPTVKSRCVLNRVVQRLLE